MPGSRPHRRPGLDQTLNTQLDVLWRAGCDEIVQDWIKGMGLNRPTLDELRAKLRAGDTVMTVGRCRRPLFRLGRSRDHLIALLSGFAQKDIHVKALDLSADSATPAGKRVVQIFAALAGQDATGRPATLSAGENPGGPVAGSCQRKAFGKA